jgi:hypothetical protein
MNYGKEFKSFTKDQGVNAMYMIKSAMTPTNMTLTSLKNVN